MITDIFYSKNGFFVHHPKGISQYQLNESGSYFRIRFQTFQTEEDTTRVFEDLKNKFQEPIDNSEKV